LQLPSSNLSGTYLCRLVIATTFTTQRHLAHCMNVLPKGYFPPTLVAMDNDQCVAHCAQKDNKQPTRLAISVLLWQSHRNKRTLYRYLRTISPDDLRLNDTVISDSLHRTRQNVTSLNFLHYFRPTRSPA
jgi:hypothetical protein